MRVYFPHRLRWLLVSGMSVTACSWTCNSTGFLERRGWQGPAALREIGKALLASRAWLCSQLHTQDFSTEGLLPRHYPKRRAKAEEMSPTTSLLPRWRTTPASLITFLSLDPSHGCCSLSAFSFTNQSRLLREGLGWGCGRSGPPPGLLCLRDPRGFSVLSLSISQTRGHRC